MTISNLRGAPPHASENNILRSFYWLYPVFSVHSLHTRWIAKPFQLMRSTIGPGMVPLMCSWHGHVSLPDHYHRMGPTNLALWYGWPFRLSWLNDQRPDTFGGLGRIDMARSRIDMAPSPTPPLFPQQILQAS